MDPHERPTSAWAHLFEPAPPEPSRRPRPPWWVVAPLVVVGVVVIALVVGGVLGLVTNFRAPWGPGSQEVNPFAEHPAYADPSSRTAQGAQAAEDAGSPDAPVLRRLAETPQGIWLVPEEHGPGDVGRHVERVVAEAGDTVPVLVVYGIPQRDCTGGFSAGGLAAEEYVDWIGEIVEGLERADRAAVVLEPDALVSVLECAELGSRIDLIRQAVGLLAESRAAVYIDAGHSGWRTPEEVADLLEDVGVERVRGFATNVANSQPEALELAYADAINAELPVAVHAVVDTGRNGNGAGETFCNAPGLALGAPPGAAEEEVWDARLWIKPPGESDGTCNGGPPAGTFWPERAVELARAAGW
ncbi:glycoside hydrolase family 6 protein [Nocardioides massiliensis]|uniref:Glucanase n=1 Tax=Nocardioides massiliensis TaxID=1325935 RepID=A0ABT9NUW6_9ACTN|nr:glycoside hydrolase family 6 protein [Nocardioides massiliensis]MDP9824228.1 endoglucanase [Nocardioides massiliensis]